MKPMKKNRIPRKTKKQYKNSILTLDISLIPDGFTVDKWMYYAKKMQILIYDSQIAKNDTQLESLFKIIKLKTYRKHRKIKYKKVDINSN